jgi:GWxTD domain-containing protein
MCWRFRYVFFFLMAFLTGCAAFWGRDRQQGYFYLSQARAAADSGNIEQALRYYDQATFYYHSLSEAYFEAAMLYLQRGGVQNRIRAARYLQKAVAYNPGNTRYRIELAKLDFQRRLFLSAKSEAEKVLEMDSTSAEAHLLLGRIAEQDFFHFSGMRDGDTSGAVIYFDEFAHQAWKKAVYHYRKALEYEPSLQAAAFRLALLYCEKRQWHDMVSVLKGIWKKNPDEVKTNFYLGLASVRLREFQKAQYFFDRALGHLPAEKRSKLLSLSRLFSASEALPSRDTCDADGEIFWRQRDPLFLTNYNERLLEHLARIAYVDLRFGNPREKLHGWDTDRGKVYVRYGNPLKRYKTRASLQAGLDVGNPLVPSKEIWEYPGFQFVFEDRFLSGEYRFQWGEGPYDDYLDIYRRLVRELPEFYIPDLGGGYFTLPVVLRRFFSPERGWVYYFYTGIPVGAVNRLFFRNENRVTARLEKGVFVFDSTWTPVFERRRSVLLEAYLGQPYGKDYFLDVDSVALNAGSHILALEYFDPQGKHAGRFLDTLTVEDETVSGPVLSDLILANAIRLRTDLTRVSRRRIRVYPNFEKTFRSGQDLHLYFEIYGLSVNAAGNSRYRISFVLRRDSAKKNLRNLLSRLLHFQPQTMEVVSSYEYRGRGPSQNHYQILRLQGMDEGRYRLIVQVEDLISGETARRSETFIIRKVEQ